MWTFDDLWTNGISGTKMEKFYLISQSCNYRCRKACLRRNIFGFAWGQTTGTTDLFGWGKNKKNHEGVAECQRTLVVLQRYNLVEEECNVKK